MAACGKAALAAAVPHPNLTLTPKVRMHACEAWWCAARLEAAELARVTDSALSLAAAPAPPLVFSEAEDEAAPADRQAWAQVRGFLLHPLCVHPLEAIKACM